MPYEQSTMMVEAFVKEGVEYRLISIPGGEHGLDGGDPQLIDQAYASAFDFVDQHIQR